MKNQRSILQRNWRGFLSKIVTYKEIVVRKIFAASATIILLTGIYLLVAFFQTNSLSSNHVNYPIEDISSIFVMHFYGVYIYGLPVSFISDSLANSISITIRSKEVYISVMLHMFAGSLLGFASLIPAITFFIIDRTLLIKRLYNLPITAIIVLSLCLIILRLDLKIGELIGF